MTFLLPFIASSLCKIAPSLGNRLLEEKPGRCYEGRRMKHLACLLLLGLAACVPVATNPAGDAAHAVFDARLQGAWRAVGKPGDAPLYAYVGPADEDARGVQAVLVEQKADGGWKVDAYHGITTRRGDHGLLSVRYEEPGNPMHGWVIMRYAVPAPGRIELRPLDGERLAAAVRAGKLAGAVSKDVLGAAVRLTASSAELIAFLDSPEGEELFAPPLPFARLEPTTAAPSRPPGRTPLQGMSRRVPTSRTPSTSCQTT
jgi:hypothetical protein